MKYLLLSITLHLVVPVTSVSAEVNITDRLSVVQAGQFGFFCGIQGYSCSDNIF